MHSSLWDMLASALWLPLLAVVVLLALSIWSIRRHRNPKLNIDCDTPIEEMIGSLAGLTHGVALDGNAVDILENANFFDVLIAEIRSARKTVHFETFLW